MWLRSSSRLLFVIPTLGLFLVICIELALGFGAYNVSDQPLYAVEFDVRDYGAVGDGRTDNTAAFRAAFEAAETYGGGIVVAAEGRYLTGPVDLKSKTYLQVNKDALILGSTKRESYPDTPSSIIRCFGQSETGIVGGGVIDGQAVPMYVQSYNRGMDQLEPYNWGGPENNCTARFVVHYLNECVMTTSFVLYSLWRASPPLVSLSL